MATTWVLIGAGALALAIVLMFNTLVRRRNAVDNAFAGVDAYLTMRYDLIPNLVETVKGYAKHEGEVLARVTEQRAQAMSGALGTDARVRLDNSIAQGMQRLIALGEAYPDLQASHNFQQLQRSLNEVEERVSAARRAFNACVNDFNNAVELFPINLVARAMGLQRRAFFEAPEPARQAARVG
jgi:LemA protein